MGRRGNDMIRRYWAAIRRYRQAGYDGTSARKKAYDQTFGCEIKTINEDESNAMEVTEHDEGLSDEEWIEDPDHPGEFRLGGNGGADGKKHT